MVERQQLVSQINNATAVVYNQLGRMKALDKRFGSMEDYFLQQITANIKAGNNTKAKMLANELANIRKIRRTTQHTGMALEALVIRFSTLSEFAAILDTIDPTVEMIKGIHEELTKAIPSATQAFSEVSTVTAGVLSSSEVRGEVGKIATPMDAEALSILNEIEGALETEAKAKLPEIPADMPTGTRQQQKSLEQGEEEPVLVEG
jgi:division protein CdvB (Snf7/Vps24/ESCRT-III family)